MTFSSHLWAHSVCRRTLPPPIQILAKGQVGLLLKPSLRAALSYNNSRACQAEDERVYILGTGNVAQLFAHSLAKKPSPPPITLLWRVSSMWKKWNDSGKVIKIRRDNSFEKQNAFDAEFLARDDDPVLVGGQIGKLTVCTNLIRNLILCQKDEYAMDAISSIKHRLNEQSTILFAQNCFSSIEEVSEQIFPDNKSRPNFVACDFSHVVHDLYAFTTAHKKIGAVSLRALPRGQLADARNDESDSTPPAQPSRYLIQQILDTPILAGKEVSTTEIIQLLMEKLLSQAMTYPLLVIFGQPTKISTRPKIQNLRQLLLREASPVVRALPELQGDAELAAQFLRETERAFKRIRDQGVEACKPFETDSMNEYIIKRGEQLGIDCSHHRTLVKMVNENRVIKESQIDEFFPPERGSER